MKIPIKKGLGFGVASGVITTLGLMVGLNASTHNTNVVLGGILVIAVADSLADALGVHISEESGNNVSIRDTWLAALSAFVSKFILALSFTIPLFILDLKYAVIVGVIWGMILLAVMSYYIAKQNSTKPTRVVLEHLGIGIFVIITTYLIGNLVDKYFN